MDAPKTPVASYQELDEHDTVVDADLILQHKENIQPLASGRRAAALAGSLLATPKQKETRLAAERAQMEEDVELAMDNDDDPLAAWIRYVNWTVDNYPQGVSAESGLLELLERATRVFSADPRYRNDMRYLKLWIQYASCVDHPIKIFSYLNTNEIGTAYSLFYEEYCNALEKSGRREEAMDMYDIGIARRAHPLARLQARKRDFSLRMINSPLPSTIQAPAEASSRSTGRAALGERKSKKPATESRAPVSNNQASTRQNNFQIFTDGDAASGDGNAWPELETRDAQRKENYRSAVPAQGEVLKQSILDAPRTPRVEVYVDEEDVPKTPARHTRDEISTLSAKKPGMDTLKKDPLRNHIASAPEPAPVGKEKGKQPLKTTNSSGSKVAASSSSKPKSSRSLPSIKPNERLQIDVSMLVLSDGTEIHPLERRARDFGVADKKWPDPSPEQMALPGAFDDPFSPRAGDHHTKVDFEGTKSMALGNTTYTGMSKDPTVTINTKEALMAVYGMYNSPTKSMTGNAFQRSLVDPNQADLPTPMPQSVSKNENAGQRTPFQPFFEESTPAANRISSENQRTPGMAFRTPGASKGLSTGKRTLSLKRALQPVGTFAEEDENDEEYEPVTPAPVRQAKPLAIIPFMDEVPKSSPVFQPRPNAQLQGDEDDGPQDEEDIFSAPKPKVAFQPFQDEEDFEEAVFHDEDAREVPETSDDEMGEEYNEEEEAEYEAGPHRWAPALTPITERTYEHTGNWTTPLHIRDRTVAETPFAERDAYEQAERLAAELQAADNLADPDASQAWEEPPDVEEDAGLVCDPYTKSMTAQLIERLPMPAGQHDLRTQTCGQLERLQKFFDPKGRKSSGSKRGEDAYILNLDGDEYEVHRKLGEGGFGAVFLADDLQLLGDENEDSNMSSAVVAIKVVKPAILWESYALDRIHSMVDESTRRSIISPRSLYVYEDESYHVLEFSNHGTLLEAVNKAGDLKVGSGLGGAASTIPGMDEMLAMFFTVELLRTLEGLHSAGFIHGDLKIDNCMVRLEKSDEGLSTQYDPSGGGGWSSKGVMLIDFGRAIDTSLFPRGTSYVTGWKMDKRDCLEMREGRPWTYETDYYGLAGVVFCLLYGKYMELPVVKDGIQRLPATLKRYWKTTLWERLFSALLNPNGFGKSLPITDELRMIRRDMETWLVENGSRSTRPVPLRGLLKRLEALSC